MEFPNQNPTTIIWPSSRPMAVNLTTLNTRRVLLNVHGAKDVRQEEIHTAEPLVPEPSAFEVELAIQKLKKNTNHQVLIKSKRN